MLKLIEARRTEIADLCRRFHVRRLEVFGSAARGTDFDPARSDVDLLVTYDPTLTPIFGICFPTSHLWTARKLLALRRRGSGSCLLSTDRRTGQAREVAVGR